MYVDFKMRVTGVDFEISANNVIMPRSVLRIWQVASPDPQRS